MFLKHLINPKPTIILFFVVFCVVFISIPLINYDFNTIFINSNTPSYLVFFLGLTLPFFQGLGLNNLVYEKNIIRKDPTSPHSILNRMKLSELKDKYDSIGSPIDLVELIEQKKDIEEIKNLLIELQQNQEKKIN